MSSLIAGRCTVVAVQEHSRTIRGRRDIATGAAITEQVNLGWHVHIDAGGSILSIPFGHERPNVKVGEELIWELRRA